MLSVTSPNWEWDKICRDSNDCTPTVPGEFDLYVLCLRLSWHSARGQRRESGPRITRPHDPETFGVYGRTHSVLDRTSWIIHVTGHVKVGKKNEEEEKSTLLFYRFILILALRRVRVGCSSLRGCRRSSFFWSGGHSSSSSSTRYQTTTTSDKITSQKSEKMALFSTLCSCVIERFTTPNLLLLSSLCETDNGELQAHSSDSCARRIIWNTALPRFPLLQITAATAFPFLLFKLFQLRNTNWIRTRACVYVAFVGCCNVSLP